MNCSQNWLMFPNHLQFSWYILVSVGLHARTSAMSTIIVSKCPVFWCDYLKFLTFTAYVYCIQDGYQSIISYKIPHYIIISEIHHLQYALHHGHRLVISILTIYHWSWTKCRHERMLMNELVPDRECTSKKLNLLFINSNHRSLLCDVDIWCQ